MILRLIDTHAHLDQLLDLENVVDRAKKAGLEGIVAVSVNYDSSIKTIEFSRKYKDYIFPAIGIHPWDVEKDTDKAIEFIKDNVISCVALGEIGLDYWIKTDKTKQKEIFEKLLKIATEKDKPISIHSRGAWEEAFALVEKLNVKNAVFHWYSGPLEILNKIFERGYYISASPSSEYSKKHREAIFQTPLENLLLETDCPVKYKGVESEPADVLKTLKYVSKLKEIKEETVAETTTENAIKLFRL